MSRHRRITRFYTAEQKRRDAKIAHRLRHYDPHQQTPGDFVPCWCHGRWWAWDSWEGLLKRKK